MECTLKCKVCIGRIKDLFEVFERVMSRKQKPGIFHMNTEYIACLYPQLREIILYDLIPLMDTLITGYLSYLKESDKCILRRIYRPGTRDRTIFHRRGHRHPF